MSQSNLDASIWIYLMWGGKTMEPSYPWGKYIPNKLQCLKIDCDRIQDDDGGLRCLDNKEPDTCDIHYNERNKNNGLGTFTDTDGYTWSR